MAVDNPLLRLGLSTRRQKFVLICIALLFAVLAGRALQLQLIKTESLQRFGERSYTQTIELAASRGKILDRHNVVLASSLPARAIYADPQRLADATDEQMKELAKSLELSEKSLRRKVTRGSRNFAYLKRQLPVDRAKQLLKLRIPGVHWRGEFKRHYPEGMISAHVVGFTDYDDVGREGIEHAHNQWLTGSVGSRRILRDRYGRIIDDMQVDKPPRHGKDKQLSIDSRLQFLTFNALRDGVERYEAQAGAAIAIDVRTGEILAMANWPSYDPNNRKRLSMDAVRNRAVYDNFEPGSTIKPFTAALALELRKFTPRSIIDTGNGKLTIGPDTIGDTHSLGVVTLEQAIQKSSNVALAKVGLDLQAQDLWQFYTALGFGQSPDIGFPGAAAGRLRPHRKWRPIEQATMSYGHGMSVSLLQLARAYLVFARDGNMPEVTIHRKDEAYVEGRQLISKKSARIMRRMLELASAPGGTAPKAQVVGYRVAGKTGTSKKQERGKYVKKYVSSYVGYVPASDPRVLIAVSIDEPTGKLYYAGDVAAPVFARIAEDSLRQLRVAPDAPVAQIQVPGRSAEVATK